MALECKLRLWYMGDAIALVTSYAATGTLYFHVDTGYQADFLNHAETIISADATGERFGVYGDRTLRYPATTAFRVRESAGNDGTWTVATAGANIVGNQTYLTVTGNVTSGTAGGSIGLVGRKFYSTNTENTGWFTVADTYLCIKCAALTTAPSAGAVLTQATSGATLTIVGSDTANDLIWGIATGTWDATNTFTKTSGTGTLDPSPCTPSAIRTTIKTTETLTNSTSGGALYLADYMDFDSARFFPTWSKPGELVLDRLGLAHRITPPTSPRFVIGGNLYVPWWDIDTLSYNGLRFPEFIKEAAVLADGDFRLYTQQSSQDEDGNDYSEKLYFDINFEDIPEVLLGTRFFLGSEPPQDIIFPIFVSADGEFTNFDSPTSIVARSRT